MPDSRPATGRFEKGRSGNPSGRPKKLLPDGRSLTDLAKAETETALAVLVEVAADRKLPSAARVSAAVALLDRGWGKPAQSVELTGAEGGPIETLDVSRAPEDVLRWMAAQAVVGDNLH